jgi:hypothetical protein
MIRGVGPSELTCGGTGPTEHDDVGVGTLAPSCVAQDSRSPLGRVPHGRRRQAGGLLAVAFDRRGNEHTRCREPDVTLTSGTPTGWSFCRDERARRRAAQIGCFESFPAQRSARTHRLGLAGAGTAIISCRLLSSTAPIRGPPARHLIPAQRAIKSPGSTVNHLFNVAASNSAIPSSVCVGSPIADATAARARPPGHGNAPRRATRASQSGRS